MQESGPLRSVVDLTIWVMTIRNTHVLRRDTFERRAYVGPGRALRISVDPSTIQGGRLRAAAVGQYRTAIADRPYPLFIHHEYALKRVA